MEEERTQAPADSSPRASHAVPHERVLPQGSVCAVPSPSPRWPSAQVSSPPPAQHLASSCWRPVLDTQATTASPGSFSPPGLWVPEDRGHACQFSSERPEAPRSPSTCPTADMFFNEWEQKQETGKRGKGRKGGSAGGFLEWRQEAK